MAWNGMFWLPGGDDDDEMDRYDDEFFDRVERRLAGWVDQFRADPLVEALSRMALVIFLVFGVIYGVPALVWLAER